MIDVVLFVLAGLTPRAVNLMFAGVCLAAALGLGPRWVAVLSGLLYLGLAFG